MRVPIKEQSWLLIAQNYQADTQVGSFTLKRPGKMPALPQKTF